LNYNQRIHRDEPLSKGKVWQLTVLKSVDKDAPGSKLGRYDEAVVLVPGCFVPRI